MRIALFPGTFDPITKGHVDIIDRGLELFDKIIVGIGVNHKKTPMFSQEVRENWIREIYQGNDRVDVLHYEGLTIDVCQRVGAQFILRGIRYSSDFEYEKGIADLNRTMSENIDTVFLTSSPAYATISSTLVRDVIRNGGDKANGFLPEAVKNYLKEQS